MDEETKDFLLAEYESSWRQVLNIDTRRGTFFNYYNLAFFAVLAFTANLLSRSGAPSLPTAVLLTIVYVLLILMGTAVVGILESERAANVRYRNKINLIRQLFLEHLDDPDILFYMQQKDIGIKTFSKDRESIDKVGRTLRGIFRLVDLERYALGVLVILVWVGYFFIPKPG